MISEKLRRILKSKSPFSDEEISRLTEKEGWAWVYANDKQKIKGSPLQVCFTGFGLTEREELEAMAEQAGLVVAKSVTKELGFLCVGENAGPSKVEKARNQKTVILTREEFEAFLETGEIPQ